MLKFLINTSWVDFLKGIVLSFPMLLTLADFSESPERNTKKNLPHSYSSKLSVHHNFLSNKNFDLLHNSDTKKGTENILINANPFITADQKTNYGSPFSNLEKTFESINVSPDWTRKYNIDISQFKSPGDINNDGFYDYILNEGKVIDNQFKFFCYQYFGSSSGINEYPDDSIDILPFLKGDGLYSNNFIGDINNDGYDDVAFAGVDSIISVGLGSENGFQSTPVWSINLKDFLDVYYEMWPIVQSAGDINNDGYGDIIIAARGPMQTVVFFGSSTGLSMLPAWISTPLSGFTNDFYQSNMYEAIGLGDINSDGFGDILTNSSLGYARVYLGNETGIDSIPHWSATPLGGDWEFVDIAKRTIEVGDFNGDGQIDLAVYEREASYDQEQNQSIFYTDRVYIVYSNDPWGFEHFADPVHIISKSETGYYFPGQQTISSLYISSLGDINNDGYDDLSVGSLIYFGTWEKMYIIPEEKYSTLKHIRAIGDVNGDGYDDIYGIDNSIQLMIFHSPEQEAFTLECQEYIVECRDPTKTSYTVPPLITKGKIHSISFRVVSTNGSFIRAGTGTDASGTFSFNSFLIWRVQDYMGITKICTTRFVSPLNTMAVPTPVQIKSGYAHIKGDPNTFYIGYGNNAFRIEALPSGGSGPYTYLWSNDSNEKNPRIAETIPGEYNYWVKMTNVWGCTSTDSTIIKVENALCSSPLVDVVMSQYPMILQNPTLANLIKSNSKIAVCKDGQTLCFNKAVVDIRISREGYTIGACTPGVIPAEAFMTDEMENILRGEMKVIVAPNPSSHSFQISVVSIYNAPVIIRIMDLAGRQVELLNNVSANQTITVGHKLRAGTYIAEVISGKERKVVKLVKIN